MYHGYVFVRTIREVVNQPGHYEFQLFPNALEQPYRVHCEKAVLDKVRLLEQVESQWVYMLVVGRGGFHHSFADYAGYQLDPYITIWASEFEVLPGPDLLPEGVRTAAVTRLATTLHLPVETVEDQYVVEIDSANRGHGSRVKRVEERNQDIGSEEELEDDIPLQGEGNNNRQPAAVPSSQPAPVQSGRGSQRGKRKGKAPVTSRRGRGTPQPRTRSSTGSRDQSPGEGSSRGPRTRSNARSRDQSPGEGSSRGPRTRSNARSRYQSLGERNSSNFAIPIRRKIPSPGEERRRDEQMKRPRSLGSQEKSNVIGSEAERSVSTVEEEQDSSTVRVEISNKDRPELQKIALGKLKVCVQHRVFEQQVERKCNRVI
ncbi:uncharacterized protein BYT42DRAFT_214367 [Radiomyces spectabilis]|uniref:uncharacterized protein n=1 Tax=Radiomyces spectabilis TaxID=64574 RepID=UPI002220A7A7|nr:uncharacterized protein BYT42DRAFT_214367 [Radiomyces spectabilis]KAI8364144.1 hypothetical protein BYT42DRAFT_214367 [Radiomyces spectabilis]